MKIVKWLSASFDNQSPGASARKLTAFALMVCVAYIHFKFVDKDNAIEALIVDLCGIGFFLGLITVSQLIELRNGSIVKTTKTETTINEQSTITEQPPVQN